MIHSKIYVTEQGIEINIEILNKPSEESIENWSKIIIDLYNKSIS